MKTTKIHALALAARLLSIICRSADAAPAALVVHEWGTFTSFQGGDGELQSWKPLEASRLPGFVYNWSKPGLERVSVQGASSNSLGFVNKSTITAKQRMETPVVYFYSDAARTVDLTVRFPEGLITEWFPQADLIGPSIHTNGQENDGFRPTMFSSYKPSLHTNSQDGGGATPESLIRWSNLRLLPMAQPAGPALSPTTSESQYFAARETDSDYVSTTMSGTDSPLQAKAETEKFLFYRGAGNFGTPLRVTMSSDDAVVLANTGDQILAHLFILGVKDKAGNFVYASDLRPGEERKISIQPQSNFLPADELSAQLGDKLAAALVQSGLYPKEAKAMVNTWRDSWIQENGLRVLYTLPQAWTDGTLPMTLNPAPGELVRVMVGRAEILPPGQEQALALQFNHAMQGDATAAAQAHALLQSLGRFGEPAFDHVLAITKPRPEELTKLMELISHRPPYE